MVVVVGWAAEVGGLFVDMEPGELSVHGREERSESIEVDGVWRLPTVDVAAPGTSHGFGGDAIVQCENPLSSLLKLA